MGKIVVTEFVSLDGVIEDPGGSEDFKHGGWTFEISRGEEGDQFKLDELREAEAQLLGRVTYEGFAAAWPKMTDRGELRREDELDAQVRLLLDPGGGELEQLDDPLRRLRRGDREAEAGRRRRDPRRRQRHGSSRAWSSTSSSTRSD